MKRYKFILVLTVLMVSMFCGPSEAKFNFKIGTVEIHPVMAVEEMYDDNIFTEETGEENRDWLTTTTVGCGIKKPFKGEARDLYFEGDFNSDIVEYFHHSNKNRVDHSSKILAELKFAEGFSWKAENIFLHTASPATDEFTALRKRIYNRAVGFFSYKKNKLGLDLGFRNTRDFYNHSGDINSQNYDRNNKFRNEYITTLYYKIFPKTSILAEANYGNIMYDVPYYSDSSYYRLLLGVSGDIFGTLFDKVTGTLKAGYDKQQYATSSIKGFDSLYIKGDMTYFMKERTKISLSLMRDPVESTSLVNGYYIKNAVAFGIDHDFLPRLHGKLNAGYSLLEYPRPESGRKQKVNLWDAETGLSYDLAEWAIAEIFYEYKRKDSNMPGESYYINRYMSKITLEF